MIVIIFIVGFSGLLLYFDGAFDTKTVNNTRLNYNYGDPIQTTYDGKYGIVSTPINHIIFNYQLTPVSNYDMSGRVLNIKKYYVSELGISPMDLCVAWGGLANEANYDNNVSFWQSGRQCMYHYDTTIKDSAYKSHFSNSHIIPANGSVADALNSIEVNDAVEIKGYLVDVTKTIIFFNGQKHWTTSTTRSDEGDGACEIIYVTSVTILHHR